MRKIFLFILILSAAFCMGQSYKEEILKFREEYKKGFILEERSPLKKGELKYLQFFEPDETFKVTAEFIKTENAIPFDIPTMNGKSKKYIEYGKFKFTLLNRELVLTAYQGLQLLEKPEFKNYLFVPFTDSTNGKETYINGRYLDFNLDDINNGKMEIDFNKAYNPYCAFSDGYNCPKPPEENDLKIAIRAGEKKFGKSRH